MATVGAMMWTSCGGSQATDVSKQVKAEEGGTVSLGGDVTLRIPPGALSEDAVVRLTRGTEEDSPPSVELEGATPLGGHAFHVDLGAAELTGPVTLEVRYDGVPEEDATVFLAFYDEDEERWVPVDGTVDPGREIIVVETDHLSWWQPWTWDVPGIAQRLGESVSRVLGVPLPKAPECGSALGFTVETTNEVMLGCAEDGRTQGEARLKLANNRNYSMLVWLTASSRLESVERDSVYDLIQQEIASTLDGDVVYVPGGKEARLLLQFSGAGELRHAYAASELSLAIDLGLALLRTRLAGVTLGGTDVETVLDHVDCIVTSFDALGFEPGFDDSFGIVRDCVGNVLTGWRAALWSAVSPVLGTIVVGTQSITYAADQLIGGGGAGEAIVTYRPLATPTPVPTATPTMPSAQEIEQSIARFLASRNEGECQRAVGDATGDGVPEIFVWAAGPSPGGDFPNCTRSGGSLYGFRGTELIHEKQAGLFLQLRFTASGLIEIWPVYPHPDDPDFLGLCCPPEFRLVEFTWDGRAFVRTNEWTCPAVGSEPVRPSC